MALKNSAHDIDKAAAIKRTPQQIALESNKHLRPENPDIALQRAENSHPSALRPADILVLQRTIGNRAVQRMLSNQSKALRSEQSASANLVQRKTEEKEPLQTKFETSPTTENRTGLPDKLKARIANLSGLAMDDVRVHYNSAKPAQVDALAYTQGTDIHLGPGEEQHLPHEAWHVVQQKQGRVRPTLQASGLPINDDKALETEADAMSVLASRMPRNETRPGNAATGRLSREPARTEALQAKLINGGKKQSKEAWNKAKGWAKAKEMINDEDVEYFREDIVREVEKEQLTRKNKFHTALKSIVEENGTKGVMQYSEIKEKMLEKDFFLESAVDKFLNESETYTVATIANAKALGALGHHIFIEYEDATVSEWAGPETKASYPHSQADTRKVTRARVAQIRMSARKHGGRGQQARYFKLTDKKDTQATYEGYVYFPWYQDCFNWVDNVLQDAEEPKNTSLVRLSKGAVGKWAGGLVVLMVGLTMWMQLGSSES
jgi:hypothetical protein